MCIEEEILSPRGFNNSVDRLPLDSEVFRIMIDHKRCVLVVDDDADFRYAIAAILGRCECQVYDAESIESALEVLQIHSVDTIFCDMRFQCSLGGEDLLAAVVRNYPHIDVVLMSSSLDRSKKTELQAKGAAFCLQKPFFKDSCMDVFSMLDRSHQRAA